MVIDREKTLQRFILTNLLFLKERVFEYLIVFEISLSNSLSFTLGKRERERDRDILQRILIYLPISRF